MNTSIDVLPGWVLYLCIDSQWDFLFENPFKWNWIPFTLINIQFEYGSYKGKYFEFAFTLIGFSFRFELYERRSRDEFSRHMDELLGEYLNKEDKEKEDGEDTLPKH